MTVYVYVPRQVSTVQPWCMSPLLPITLIPICGSETLHTGPTSACTKVTQLSCTVVPAAVAKPEQRAKAYSAEGNFMRVIKVITAKTRAAIGGKEGYPLASKYRCAGQSHATGIPRSTATLFRPTLYGRAGCVMKKGQPPLQETGPSCWQK